MTKKRNKKARKNFLLETTYVVEKKTLRLLRLFERNFAIFR